MSGDLLDTCLTWGCPEYVIRDGHEIRARYVVADAIDAYAKELSRDRAGVVRYIANEIRYGGVPSKKSRLKASKELGVIRQRLSDTNVDGMLP